jgi:hypothetical protein
MSIATIAANQPLVTFLLTPMTEDEHALKTAADILRTPYLSKFVDPTSLHYELFQHYFTMTRYTKYDVWVRRHWFADQIEAYLAKKTNQIWWEAAMKSPTMQGVEDYEAPAGPHHKLVIYVTHTDGERLWWISSLPLQMENGKPWDFSERVLKNPSSPVKDVREARLVAVETVNA